MGNSLKSKDQLVRGLLEVVHGSVVPLKLWGPMVFPKERSPEALLNRLKAFPILYCTIRDTVHAETRYLKKLANDADIAGFDRLALNTYTFGKLCRSGIPIIQAFSSDEQILLSLLRDRFVHGYLSGTTNDTRGILVFSNGRFERQEISKARQREILGDDKDGYELNKLNEKINRISQAYEHYAQKWYEIAKTPISSIKEALENGYIIIPEE